MITTLGGDRPRFRLAVAAGLRCRWRAAPPRPAERLQLAAEQQELVTTRGDLGLLIARNPMGWTGTGFPGAPQLRHALIRAPTPPDALALLDTAAAQLG